ncbi:MAG: hypothetical protein ACI97A_002584 [Planctomycetota bacterium]|jgi:hypothetical protein
MSKCRLLLPAIAVAILSLALQSTAQTFRSVPSTYSTIQDAIDASVDGDTVHISPGTYSENIDFKGKLITVRGAWGAALTTIDGGLNGPVVSFVTGEGNSSVLADLTLTNGLGVDGTNSNPNGNPSDVIGTAGGIWIKDSAPTIRHCIVVNNQGGNADGEGTFAGGGGVGINGAPFQFSSSNAGQFAEQVVFKGCRILANTGGSQVSDNFSQQQPLSTDSGVDSHGAAGGIDCRFASFRMTGSVIASNVGGDCLFQNGRAGAGGVAARQQSSQLIIRDSNIINNTGGDIDFGGEAAGDGGIFAENADIVQAFIKGNHGGNVNDDFGNFTLTDGGGSGGADTRAGTGGLFIRSFVSMTDCRVKENFGGDIESLFLFILTGDGGSDFEAGTGGLSCFDGIIRSTLIDRNEGGDALDLFGFPDNEDGFDFTSGTGAILHFGTSLTIDLSTIVDNKGGMDTDDFSEGGVKSFSFQPGVVVENSILWGNRGFEANSNQNAALGGPGIPGPQPINDDQLGGPAFYLVSFCDVEGGFSGSGNIDLDPDFVDRVGCDYHLKLTSPCVNVGDPQAQPAPGAEDIDGDPRLMDNRCDMGADETNFRHYPGADSDLVLETIVNYWGSPDSSVRYVTAGDFLSIGIISPMGTYDSSTFAAFGQAFATGMVPSHPGVPELHLDLASVVTPAPIIVLAPGGFEIGESFIPNGRVWAFDVPSTFPGFSLMVQGVAMDSGGIPTITDGHELRFR